MEKLRDCPKCGGRGSMEINYDAEVWECVNCGHWEDFDDDDEYDAVGFDDEDEGFYKCKSCAMYDLYPACEAKCPIPD
jgi:Zn ribbon nucleic-acid-binding protein